jgi:hypothetical protein
MDNGWERGWFAKALKISSSGEILRALLLSRKFVIL